MRGNDRRQENMENYITIKFEKIHKVTTKKKNHRYEGDLLLINVPMTDA